MIPQSQEEVTSSLVQEGTVMKNVFNQLSAEEIYYAYLYRRNYDPDSSFTLCVSNKSDTNSSSSQKKGGAANNKGPEEQNNSNSKKNKDLVNKNKLFQNLLSEEYWLIKSRSFCESKEGLYHAITAGCGPNKTNKTDKNQSNHKKLNQKTKENGLTNQKPNENGSSVVKNGKVKSGHHKSSASSASSETEDSNIKATRRNEMYLIWSLAGDYRLMKWKKKREKAEGRYQKYLANRRKRELKKENAHQNNMMKQQNNAGSNGNSSALGMGTGTSSSSSKSAKKFIKKKPFVIQKSLGYDYRHCLKKKKNREEDEASYQMYLASITPPLPHSISGAACVAGPNPPKIAAAPKALSTGGRQKAKPKLNVSFDLPEEDEIEASSFESKDLLLYQCLALDSANMSWRQRCEGSEANYQIAIGMKEKNNIKL